MLFAIVKTGAAGPTHAHVASAVFDRDQSTGGAMARSMQGSDLVTDEIRPFRLDPARLKTDPLRFPHFSIGIPSGMLALPELEDLICRIARDGSPTDLICRSSATAPDDDVSIYLEDRDFSGRLERRLREENIHIMVTHADRYSPRIRELVDPFFAMVRPAFDAAGIGMLEPSSALFISSPRSLARLHNDMEYGFLHQVSGTKTIHVYPYVAGKVRPPRVPPDQWAFRSRIASRAYMAEFRDAALTATMGPGEVVYIPSLAPHWVEAGDEIAISITFLVVSEDAVRQRKIERMNRLLRNVGAGPLARHQGRVSGIIKTSLHDVGSRLGLFRNG